MIGLTIDPGKSTGTCLWRADDAGFKVIERWQFTGGAEMLHQWLSNNVFIEDERPAVSDEHGNTVYLDALVVEKFTPHDNEGFSLTIDSVEPLVCEGVLIAHDLLPFIEWGQPSQQYFMGASTLTLKEKKRLARVFLAQYALLSTGSEFGQPDADDAISATLHSIAYLRRKRHFPTLLQLFGPQG